MKKKCTEIQKIARMDLFIPGGPMQGSGPQGDPMRYSGPVYKSGPLRDTGPRGGPLRGRGPRGGPLRGGGPAAMAVRAARAHLLMNHTAMNNHNTAVVDIAKRELRQHIAMDWLHCQGKVEPQPGRLAHRGTRPATAGDFRARWRSVCAVSDSVLVVTYKRLVLPGRTDLDD